MPYISETLIGANLDTPVRLNQRLWHQNNSSLYRDTANDVKCNDCILEEHLSYTDHDRLFKLLIETFFADFMRLYFPEIHQQIDYAHLKFLRQEIFTDLTEGDKRVIDLLVETKLQDEEGLILIHIENQSYEQPKFNERMFLYFSRLYEKYRCKIIPIALFSYDNIKEEPDHFVIDFPFLNVLHFRFLTIELKKQNWRAFINLDNPVAAALLSKMGYLNEERVQVKLEFLRMITRLKLDPARIHLLTTFFETYLKLNQEEEEQLSEKIHQMPREEEVKILELLTSWEKKGLEKGLQKGMEQGRKEAQFEIAKRLIKMNMTVGDIIKATGLSREVIEQLVREKDTNA
jgi:hypothetical protein